MVNINKLRGAIAENATNVEKLADQIGVDSSTLYRKMSGDGGKFTIKEADLISKALQLTADQATAIFFAQFVA